MKRVSARILHKGLPETELISGALRRLGCEVTLSDEVSGGCEIVILSDAGFTADGLRDAVRTLSSDRRVTGIGLVSAYLEPDDITDSTGKLLLFRRPVDTASLVDALVEPYRDELTDNDELRRQITSMLSAIGYSRRKSGFDCLRDALVILVENYTGRVNLKKDVYPEAAKINGKSPSAAEKSISRINKEVWSTASEPLIREVLGSSALKNGRLPYDKEILCLLADYFAARPFEELMQRLADCDKTGSR